MPEPLVGVCGRVSSDVPLVIYPDKLIRVRLATPHLITPAFIEIAMNTGESRRFIEQRIRTTAGQSGVSGHDLRQVPVPIPPLAEQLRVAIEVQRGLSFVARLDEDIANGTRRCQRLRQALLAAAFSGSLVTGSELHSIDTGVAVG